MPDRLELVAELKNNVSPGLKKITGDFGRVKPSAGMLQAKTWFTQLSAASETASKATRPLIGGLNMIGAGGLAAGLSIAGLAKQFTDLAKALPALQELSRQTGMSRTEIERLKATAANLNIDPSRMAASLGSFSRMMVDFHRKHGAVYEEMVNHGAAGLAEKIRQEDPAAAYKDIVKWLDAIPAAAQRAGKSQADAVQIQRHWAGEALGDEDMAQLASKGMKGFQEAYQQAAQDVGQITDEVVKQAEAFDRALSRFDASWNTLKRDLGSTVLPGLTAATDGMRALFDEVKHDPELLAIGGASLGALYARRRIMRGMSGGGGGIAPATAAQIEGAAGVQKTASTTFAEAVAEFRAGVREMNARGAAPGGGSGNAVAEAEKDAKEAAPALPFFAGLGVPAAAALAILAGGGAAGAMNAQRAGEFGEDAGTAGGDAPAKDGDVLPPARPTITFATMWDWFKKRTRSTAAETPRLQIPVPEAFHPADDDRQTRARAGDNQGERAAPTSTLSPENYWARKRARLDLPAPSASDRWEHPDDDRLSRSRASDVPDRSLDGFVMGSLDKPILHLAGTLKTAAAIGDGNVRPAAFHPAALGASLASGTPGEMIAAAVKAGTLAAFREWLGMQDPDGKGGSGGFTPAAFHLGGGGGGGGNRSLGGGSFDTSGGGTTRAGGSLAANQREAYAAAIGEGLSKTAARALVADLSGEGLAHDAHRVHWDGKHNSGGIAQWDPTRAADIQKQFGKLPWEMDVAGQTRAAIWEYRNRKRFAATKAAMEGTDPAEMIRQLVVNYEDPRDKATAISQRMGYLRGFNPDAPGGSVVQDAIGKLHLAGRVTGVQCVALANAAVGFAGSVKDWRKGIGVAEGTLKDGTPIATFLNRDGSQSDRYAGGGTGTEGAHLDHAAIFRRYLKDAAGKIIGMTVAEQSRGRPLHLKDYKFGEGWGEGDGSNYHAIMGPDGKPLGGRNNPMIAPMPKIELEPPRTHEQTSRRDEDGEESHLHVHLHQDGRVRAVRSASSGLKLHLDTGRTFTQFG